MAEIPSPTPAAEIDAELLSILACPFCLSELDLKASWLHCKNAKCNCRYEIKEGIPVMLIDEAQRPCPGCQTQREWKDNVLECPKCRERCEVPPR